MQPRKRTCLRCGQLFDSIGPGNRICKACARINARIPLKEQQLERQRGIKRRCGRTIGDQTLDEDNTPSAEP